MRDSEIVQRIAQERWRELLAEAEKNRLLKASGAAKLRLRERIAVGAGDLLISAGIWLRERYRPIPISDPEVECAPG
ncbi:MAG: hypothetical protein IT330_15210 [Anaerolineae bacterium]|nr:hypothetical protein [Anaerolineae bacterium]